MLSSKTSTVYQTQWRSREQSRNAVVCDCCSETGQGKDSRHTWVIKVVLALKCFRFLIWSQHFVEAVLAYNSHLPLTMVHLVLTQELHDLGANCWLCQKIPSFTRLLFRSTLAIVIMLYYIRLWPSDSRETESVVICDPLDVVVISWLAVSHCMEIDIYYRRSSMNPFGAKI